MSYLPELNRAFGRGFFGKWFKILIDDQNIICFSLPIVGKPDREKNKAEVFGNKSSALIFSDCAPRGWLAHQYKF
jgi:hypothetical protein